MNMSKDKTRETCKTEAEDKSSEAYLNLRLAKRGSREALELELPQLAVATGHPALPSIDDKRHVGLVVMHGGEDLLAVARHGEGGGDEDMLLVPHHGNPQAGPLLGQLPPLEHGLVGGCACSTETAMRR